MAVSIVRRTLFFGIKLLVAFTYFSFGFLLIAGFYDTRLGGVQPSHMSKHETAPMRALTLKIMRQKLSLGENSELNFSQIDFKPSENLEGVIGVNPNCSPGVPNNTLDVWLNPQKYPGYSPQFQYSEEYLRQFNRKELFMQFFNKLPCNDSAKIYFVSIFPKYNSLRTYFQSMDNNFAIRYYRDDGQEIRNSSAIFWGIGLVLMLGLFWINRRFFRAKRLWYIEYPNYLLIFGFVVVSATIIFNWHFWKFIT